MVDENTTLNKLLGLIKQETGLEKFSLKYGYPLKNLETSPEALGSTVMDLRLRGETIVVAPLEPRPVEPAEASREKQNPAFVPKGVEPDETVLEWPDRGGFMGSCARHLLLIRRAVH